MESSWNFSGSRKIVAGSTHGFGSGNGFGSANSVDGDAFYDFVCSTLIHNMHPYDGVSPNSVVVMDNCSIHHVAVKFEIY